MLEGVKAEIQVLIVGEVQALNPPSSSSGPSVPPRLGLMDVVDLSSLLRCDVATRLTLFRKISRLLIACICQITWKELVSDKVFGDEPDFVAANAEIEMDVFSSAFKDFPFDHKAMTSYTNYLPQVKFHKKDDIFGPGELVH
jgi:hypothetical protein